VIEVRRSQNYPGVTDLCRFDKVGPAGQSAATIAPRARGGVVPATVGQATNGFAMRATASLAAAAGALEPHLPADLRPIAIGLDNRRRLPGARHRRRTGADRARYCGDEPVPCRAVPGRGCRGAWHRADGQGGLAYRWRSGGAKNLSLVFLPPYSPELNPIERLWLHLRDNRLTHRVFRTTEDIIDGCCDA
jgi:hypothetical protein